MDQHQQPGRVVDVYKKAMETVATVTACALLARSFPRELLPDELRRAARRCTAAVRARLGWAEKVRHTVVIRRHPDGGAGYGGENHLFDAARTYLDATMDPRATRRLSLSSSRTKEPDGTITSSGTIICMEPGCSTTDVFEGVTFTWSCVVDTGGGEDGKRSSGGGGGKGGGGGGQREALELSFDAENTVTALEQYVPFVVSTAVELQQLTRGLRIFMNEGRSWHGISHHHPSTFDTLAMDPELKRSVIADLDCFLKRREYYRRIGKAWKRGYLLYGPPGTGKSSLVAAMANYLRFNLYDLDLSAVHSNSMLQWLLMYMPNKSVLVIEDIDCCFDAAASREDDAGEASSSEPDDDPELAAFLADPPAVQPHHRQPGPTGTPPAKGITLSGLLNFIDGLWSTCRVRRGQKRIIVFTTNYKERLDPALLRPGRMDMHVYMGYCGWEAFRTLARNYFLVDEHALFPEIQELLAEVEVTPAEVSEMLLRSEDADAALQGIVNFLQDKKKKTRGARRQGKK